LNVIPSYHLFFGGTMKQFKLIVSATALTLALSFSAFAGQMETTFTSPQPTPSSATTPGQMETTFTSPQPTPSSAATQIALILLNLLP
jgi:hypothetical protein